MKFLSAGFADLPFGQNCYKGPVSLHMFGVLPASRDSHVVRRQSTPYLPFQARQVQRVLAEAEQALPEVRTQV